MRASLAQTQPEGQCGGEWVRTRVRRSSQGVRQRCEQALGSMERSLEFTLMWREASEWLQVGENHELIYV